MIESTSESDTEGIMHVTKVVTDNCLNFFIYSFCRREIYVMYLEQFNAITSHVHVVIW